LDGVQLSAREPREGERNENEKKERKKERKKGYEERKGPKERYCACVELLALALVSCEWEVFVNSTTLTCGPTFLATRNARLCHVLYVLLPTFGKGQRQGF
jgi:hypothetical protein